MALFLRMLGEDTNHGVRVANTLGPSINKPWCSETPALAFC
ncbi:hypothetical protein [Sphingobacterium hotanense]|nr:hypothetical protein [Sphingobacterium hotanense]